jgi:hypothetical protein
MYGNVWKFLLERFASRDRDVPRVSLSLRPVELQAGSRSSGPSDTIGVRWRIHLVLSNESSAAAVDLKLVWPSGEPSFKANLPFDLDPYGEKTVRLGGECAWARHETEDEGEAELFDRLLDELRATELVLTYRDLHGDNFFTRYSRIGRHESVEYLKRFPPTPA